MCECINIINELGIEKSIIREPRKHACGVVHKKEDHFKTISKDKLHDEMTNFSNNICLCEADEWQMLL